MAQPATPNHTNHNYFLNQNFNVNVFHFNNLSSESHQPDDHQVKMTSRQAIYAFIVTVLLNLVQIKFQNKSASPFETLPKTMIVAVASLLLYYYFSYHANLSTIPLSAAHPNYNTGTAAYLDYFSNMGLRFCGPLSLASVIALLLPQSLCPLVVSASLLFSFSHIIPQSHVETLWDMVTRAATFVTEKFSRQPPRHVLRRRRGGRIHVRLPDWLPQQTNIAMSNHVGILPR